MKSDAINKQVLNLFTEYTSYSFLKNSVEIHWTRVEKCMIRLMDTVNYGLIATVSLQCYDLKLRIYSLDFVRRQP